MLMAFDINILTFPVGRVNTPGRTTKELERVGGKNKKFQPAASLSLHDGGVSP